MKAKKTDTQKKHGTIFKHKELKRPSFFHKLFSKKPTQNAVIEINNLLAANEADITQVSIDDVMEILDRYNTTLKRKKYKADLIMLFTNYLRYCLHDHQLATHELKALEHLRDILLLSASDVDSVMKQETENIYEGYVKEAVSDGVLHEVEKENLTLLKEQLLISDEVAKEIYKRNAGEILQQFIDGAISNERISPNEERQMAEMANGLGINLKIDDKTKAILEKYKLYWQIENADLPEIKSPINIQKSEKLHFTAHVKWLEQRRVVKRRNYGGPTARIKLAKGVYYRVGSLRTNNIARDEWQTIDTGSMYLTNKRLIFMGAKGNKTIRINTILDINPYSNGVDIQKERGKSPFIEFNTHVDIFSMIMVRLMDEA